MDFSSSHVCMWELKKLEVPNLSTEEVMLLNCGVGEDSLVGEDSESPLDCKEIQPVHPKGDQSWVFIGRTDAEAETPILWPPNVKKRLIGKDPDARKHWRQEEKGTTEDEMVGWHHWCNGQEFEQAPGVGMDREARHAAVHGVAKSLTQLSDWTELIHNTGEGNGNPLQCSCLENSMDRGAWWAAVHGVAEIQTWLSV